MNRDPVEWPTSDPVARQAERTPDRTALVDADDGRSWSYRDLDSHVGRQMRALVSRGVEPDDTVGTLLTTSVSFAELIHAAMRLGATLVPLNADLTTGELTPQVERADLDWLLCESATEAGAVELVGTERVLSIREPSSEDVRKLDRPAPSFDEPGPVDRAWTQLVMFTSGTTGEPKGVQLTAGNLVASARGSASRLGVETGDRWLVPLPMYHMGGLAPVLRSALYGTAVVIQRESGAETTQRVVAEHGVTGVSMVPTMLTRMLDAGWQPPEHLRFVLLGGAPAPEELIDRCERRGVPVCPTYGMTETASQVATATPEEAFEREGTVGRPLEETTVTVVDDANDPVEPGETGELVVEGPTVTPGYLDDEQTEAAFGEFGLRTGDVGHCDEDGRLWVLGRVDDTVVTGGENVHPVQVADALREHPGVEDAAVVGLPDAEWGDRVAALVVGEVGLDDLEAYSRERLAGFKVPKTWEYADELPRTASGTVDREAVRELFDGGD